MNERCKHHKIDGVDSEFYLYTWSIPKASSFTSLNTIVTKQFDMIHNHYYFATLEGFSHEFQFILTTNTKYVKCSVSLFLGSATLLFSNTLENATRKDNSNSLLYHYDLISLTCDSKCYQKLKEHPNDSLTLICRIILLVDDFYTYSIKTFNYAATNSLNYMKKLTNTLKNSSSSLLKERVTLKVDEETETVNKAVLCALSPVFAKIFENYKTDNVITITDIRMPVIKALVSFLYTGILSNCDSDSASNSNSDSSSNNGSDSTSNSHLGIDLLCDLYYVGCKYDISELRHVCIESLLPRISMENIFRVSKLAFTHDDEILKATVKTFIATNIETLVSKNEWKDLFNDEPQIAVEALTFFDI